MTDGEREQHVPHPSEVSELAPEDARGAWNNKNREKKKRDKAKRAASKRARKARKGKR